MTNIGVMANRKLNEFSIGDKVETWVYMNTTMSFADNALLAGIVLKIGAKKVLVQWEYSSNPKWVYPHQIDHRTWETQNEESGLGL